MNSAQDSFLTMAHFLAMEPYPEFTQADYDQLELRCKHLAEMVAQMDAGQRGSGIDFNTLDHVFINIAVLSMRLVMSGILEDELERRKRKVRRMQKVREERGLTQQELADMIGCKQCQIAEYENKHTTPSPKRMKQIAEALKWRGQLNKLFEDA